MTRNFTFQIGHASVGNLNCVSVQNLSQINESIRNIKKYNQWKNSFAVIDWFKDLKDKKNLSFIEFDIVEFYPSISEGVLRSALNWASTITEVSEDEIEIILQTKTSLLFFDGECWVKKGNKPFDVSMGSWDGAEVADLIGLYLLSQLQDIDCDLGLYRDDGLGATSLSPRLAEKEKQKICKIFQRNGFRIKANVNAKNVNFLDINLDL